MKETKFKYTEIDRIPEDGVIFQISTFQRTIFTLFEPIREAFGSFKAIFRKIFTSGADCYVSLRMTTLAKLNSKYVPF